MTAFNKLGKITVSAMIFFAVLALSTVSAETTGQLTLTGQVPGILEISVTPEPAASTLDLSVDAEVKVATVVERSNKKAGYTVSLTSANAENGDTAFFADTDANNTDTLNYSINYGGNEIVLSGGSAVVSDVTEKTTGTGTPNDVTIRYAGASSFLYQSESYTDTLTLTIASK